MQPNNTSTATILTYDDSKETAHNSTSHREKRRFLLKQKRKKERKKEKERNLHGEGVKRKNNQNKEKDEH